MPQFPVKGGVSTDPTRDGRGLGRRRAERVMRTLPEAPALHGMSRRGLIGAGLGLTLAGCNSAGFDMPGAGGAAPAASPASGPAVGETLGSGPVRVGMILPLTQNGAPSPVGVSMRNAAQLAVDEFAASSITLMILDDHSTPEGAAQSTQSAIGAGAQLLLGPVFASDVRQAASVAKAAGRPMIAFSTDASVAGPGVYLLSFLIEGYVDRIAQFAVSRGKKNFAVMAPRSEYGDIAVAEFQQTAGRLNTPVAVIARYAPGQSQEAAQQVAAAGQIDALFIPEQADAMPGVASALASSGIKTQLLGTGVWNDARVLKLPELQGAWFAAPDNSGFNALAQRYKAKFGSQPTRLATLSYDAVTLAAALARGGGSDRYGPAALTNISGFNGADGVFRFLPAGTNERGLAVMEIDNNAATVISPAPRSFAAG